MTSVLLVEDDVNISMAFTARLKALGYVVNTAKDAVAAVAQARKCQPDVVLLDISLPAGDGFTVAERINNIEGAPTTPIIFITASNKPGLRARARRLGAVGFLNKPIAATQLAYAVDRALHPGEAWQPRAVQV